MQICKRGEVRVRAKGRAAKAVMGTQAAVGQGSLSVEKAARRALVPFKKVTNVLLCAP